MEHAFKIAMEFGYDRKQVEEVLNTYHFDNVQHLISYLFENDEIKMEAMLDSEQSCSTSVATKEEKQPNDNLSYQQLHEETVKLYKRTLCMKCRTKPRCKLSFPCCHITLCHVCVDFVDICLLCKNVILQNVNVFFS